MIEMDGQLDPSDYCRQIESHLCRKNDGHLIRIVGPAFEQVCQWAERGIPLRIAFKGIDRYFERYYSKGPRRRPVRVEFCEPDVLDAFDEWRRAVGVVAAEAEPARRPPSLPEHLDRAIAMLTTGRNGAERAFEGTLGAVARELGEMRIAASSARGAQRELLVNRLRELDTALTQAVLDDCSEPVALELRAEAEQELAPFKDRMQQDVYESALAACIERLARERFRLPTIAYDP